MQKIKAKGKNVALLRSHSYTRARATSAWGHLRHYYSVQLVQGVKNTAKPLAFNGTLNHKHSYGLAPSCPSALFLTFSDADPRTFTAVLTDYSTHTTEDMGCVFCSMVFKCSEFAINIKSVIVIRY